MRRPTLASVAMLAAALACCALPAKADDGFDDWAASDATQQVVWCESRNNPAMVGDLGEYGLLQIHPVHRQRAARLGYAWSDLLTPTPNLRVGYSLWLEQGWRPWRGCEPGE